MPDGSIKVSAAAFPAYVDALVAYRMIMQRILLLLIKEYGRDPIKEYFRVSSLAALVDVDDSHFLTHRSAVKFVANENQAKGRKIIQEMHHELKSNRDIDTFAKYCREAGNMTTAADLPFFLERRLRGARIALSTKNKVSTQERKKAAVSA